MLFYFIHGKENAPHTQGVTLMLFNEARKELIRWESHGSRITKAPIQCTELINDSNEEDKDQFYQMLQSIVDKCPGIYLIIMIGDLNVIGRHELVERNKNDETFANLRVQQNGSM
ncbi:unnamed protein product [Schistosoma margrebowiei]|uniref:Uncharacterized protein n=1 Tax=Schistosoma margrebowiei TaxID=48269 RepID=A0A183LLV8_9TREM|nr:unnamed protein product [Schistosoma margrebowiei]